MTTTHTQPAGCDLDSLPAKPHTTYNGYSDGSEPLWTAEQMEDYARAAIAARAAQAPTGLQDEQGLADEGLDYLLQYIPVPAARVAAQCKVAELRAAQAPQGDTRQGAAIALPVDLIHDFRDAIAVARHRAKHDGDTASKKRWIEVASRLDGYARSIATPAAPACTGCDPAEGFCRDCREAERKAAHTCTPADERALKALTAITERVALTYRICCGTAPKQSVGELLDVTIQMPEWEIVRATLQAIAAQGAGTAPVVADERTIVAMPEEMPDAVESAILPLMDCSSPEGFYIAIRAALAQGTGTAPVGADSDLLMFKKPASSVAELMEEVADVLSEQNWRGDLVEQLRAAATHPAPVSTAAAPELTVKLAEMRESNGNVTWDVLLVKAGDSLMNGHSVYADRIKGRAEYEANSLRHFLGQGPYPDMLAYDTDPPVAEVSTAAATTASASSDGTVINEGTSRAADGQQGASRAVLDKDTIRAVFMRHGFTVKEGQIDLKDYVYAAADELIALARAPLPAQGAAQVEVEAARYRFIEEHATVHGGGHGFTITCFVGADEEDMGIGIDKMIAALAAKRGGA